MSTTALVMMLSAWTVIAFFTIRFFIKVLRTPQKPEPDSYGDNDDVKR
ncbi:MAG: hypothetical protein HY800_07790 [Ignavibacteriales bacterium]|nr:hypothetical protein [Ignavibacteriales bacterium]